MAQYIDFIEQNVAPKGAKRIGVYNENGRKVGIIRLGNLAKPMGEKLYSFGAISDVHLSMADSESDFIRALTFLDSSKVAFTCICGDITHNGNDTQLARYKELVDANTKTPIYAITGNHETYTHGSGIETKISTYTGKPLYYTATHGNDVFIMLGIKSEGALFTNDELQWLSDTLEENRNKRCFVFQHCFLGYEKTPTCGNPNGMYHNYCWSGEGQTQMTEFKSLLEHYKNTVFFHGHSHLKFRLQEGCDYANFDESEGFRSVHIPSISRPRQEDGADDDTSPDYDDSGSEGYIVDVYENGIHLRGRDFAKGEFIPIASYWIDTTLVDIEAKPVQPEAPDVPYINQIPISTDSSDAIYNGKGWKENTYVSGSGDAAKTGYESTGFIPCKVGDVVRLKNVGFKKSDNNCSISFYSSKGNSRISLVQANSSWYMDTNFAGVVDSESNYTQFTIVNISGVTTGTAFIRITASVIDSTSIITINQEIN